MKINHLNHLCLRAGFGIGNNELKSLEQQSKPEVVSSLIKDSNGFDPLLLDLSELEDMVQANCKQGMSRMDKSDLGFIIDCFKI